MHSSRIQDIVDGRARVVMDEGLQQLYALHIIYGLDSSGSGLALTLSIVEHHGLTIFLPLCSML